MVPGSPNPELNADQKIVIFHTRFQTRSLKSIPIFGPGLIQPVPGSQIVGETPQFFPVLFSCSRFLNSTDPTISEPGTG